MREDSNWEEELPSPEELMPLSQSLITPDLASAFDIRNPGRNGSTTSTPITLFHHHHHRRSSFSPQELLSYRHQSYGVQQSSSTPHPPPTQNYSPEYESYSGELCGGGGAGVGGVGGGGGGDGGDEEPARTLKRPRLVWTPQLHKRFVDAVGHLGIKNAVPKTIMTLMSVDGLTRENVASHLQKYRLYLRRMQNINNGGASNGSGHGGGGSGDSATDQLFASSPVPAHFLNGSSSGVGAGGGARPNLDQFMSYVPVSPLHHQQVQVQQYGQHRRQMGQFGLGQVGGQFDHPFLSRQAQLGPNRNGMLLHNSPGFVEGTTSNNARKILSLFPNSDE